VAKLFSKVEGWVAQLSRVIGWLSLVEGWLSRGMGG
jgi:hypothetical protein